jgi:NADPH-dependent ferric siderophore reductase
MTDGTFAEPRDWVLVVEEVRDLTPSMRRVRLSGEDLAALDHRPGQDMAIAVPAGDGTTVRRRYTIRALHAAEGMVDLDFVLHGDGPAARWAAAAEPGVRIEAIGPRGKITVDPRADWHLFAGDEAALPGIAAMVESLAPGSVAIALVEVDGPRDEQPLEAPDGVLLELTWLHRAGVEPGRSDLLARAVREAETPAGRGHAYAAGEYGVVQGLRQTLGQLGLAREQISPKPYWRLGRRNMPHGEPERD